MVARNKHQISFKYIQMNTSIRKQSLRRDACCFSGAVNLGSVGLKQVNMVVGRSVKYFSKPNSAVFSQLPIVMVAKPSSALKPGWAAWSTCLRIICCVVVLGSESNLSFFQFYGKSPDSKRLEINTFSCKEQNANTRSLPEITYSTQKSNENASANVPRPTWDFARRENSHKVGGRRSLNDWPVRLDDM